MLAVSVRCVRARPAGGRRPLHLPAVCRSLSASGVWKTVSAWSVGLGTESKAPGVRGTDAALVCAHPGTAAVRDPGLVVLVALDPQKTLH